MYNTATTNNHTAFKKGSYYNTAKEEVYKTQPDKGMTLHSQKGDKYKQIKENKIKIKI